MSHPCYISIPCSISQMKYFYGILSLQKTATLLINQFPPTAGTLANFTLMLNFYTPYKCQKTKGFFGIFSGNRNGALAWNWLMSNRIFIKLVKPKQIKTKKLDAYFGTNSRYNLLWCIGSVLVVVLLMPLPCQRNNDQRDCQSKY